MYHVCLCKVRQMESLKAVTKKKEAQKRAFSHNVYTHYEVIAVLAEQGSAVPLGDVYYRNRHLSGPLRSLYKYEWSVVFRNDMRRGEELKYPSLLIYSFAISDIGNDSASIPRTCVYMCTCTGTFSAHPLPESIKLYHFNLTQFTTCMAFLGNDTVEYKKWGSTLGDVGCGINNGS